MRSKKKTEVPIKAVVVEAAPPSVMPEPPTKAETPGVKSFFGNYWQFVVWAAVFFAIALNNEAFKFLGSSLYLPLKAFAVFVLAFIFRQLLNKTSTGAYIKNNAYDTDFASLSARDKVFITQGQFAVYIIVIAILAASVL